MLACDKSTPELWRARVRVFNSLLEIKSMCINRLEHSYLDATLKEVEKPYTKRFSFKPRRVELRQCAN